MRRMKSRRGVLLAAALLMAIICLGPKMRAEESKQCFGHSIPPFPEVFLKLFKATADQMSLDQLKTTSTQLSDRERAAISYYLGDEGHKRLLEGYPPGKKDVEEKRAFLEDKYILHTEISPDYDFKGLYPHILAVSNNNLTLEQLQKTLDALTAADLASQSFYMGEEGRKALFSEMTLDRVEEVLKRTEDWVLIETGKRRYDRISDYTSILYKQERLGDKLQGVEKILLKYREKPHGIYMKWLEGPWAGRELVYSEKALGAGKVRVRESGFLGIIPVTLPVDSELAKRGSNHMVTEIGLKYLLGMIEKDYRSAAPKGELQRINRGMVEVDGRKVFQTESILPQDPVKGYYCYRMEHYIDFIRSLEIKAVVYRWDNQLYESYTYTQIKINSGLTDRDFDPENPDYDLD